MNFSYPSILTYGSGAQKNYPINTILLSAHKICFGLEIRKLIFEKALLIMPAEIFDTSLSRTNNV